MEASTSSAGAPRRRSSVRRPGLLRAGLVVLGLPQLAIGVWALASPRGWFDSFPGGGHHWLPAYGPYNAHLATDVGATFVAIGVVVLLAALWLERRLVQAALLGYLAYEIPHFVYHLGADHHLSSGDHVTSDISLGLTLVLALALLALTRGPTGGDRPSPAPAGGPAGPPAPAPGDR
jgi:hypothetical protein